MRRDRASARGWWVGLLAVGLAGGGVAWLGLGRLLRPKVTVTEAVEGPVVQAFYATGTLLPDREYPIKANNPGVLTEVWVDKGDVVSRGQALALVAEDAVQYRFEQAKAERELKSKQADEKTSPVLLELDARLRFANELLEIARREQSRITQMVTAQAATQADLDRAMDRVKTLASEVEALKAQRANKKLELDKDLEVAEAALKTAQWNLERQTLRSPIDNGVVLDRPVSAGTRMAVNEPIMHVADVRPESLVMWAAVDEEDKTFVRFNQTVRLTLYAFPDRVFEGKVKRIYPKADPERRTFEVDVEMMEKNPGFSAGMTGELAFVVAEKDLAIVIPSQAVQSGQVWTVRDGRLVKAEAKLGLSSVERVEVVSGLKAGDQVVISPIGNLAEGRGVRTEFMDPAAAAGLNKPKTEEGFKGFR